MSYTIKCDTHTHTLFSKHAYSTIEENVRAAAEAGMELLASTDHYSAMLYPDAPPFAFRSSGLDFLFAEDAASSGNSSVDACDGAATSVPSHMRVRFPFSGSDLKGLDHRNYQYLSTMHSMWPREWFGVTLLRGCEADIVDLDGRLFSEGIPCPLTVVGDDRGIPGDFYDSITRKMDYVIASVHGRRFLTGATPAQITRMYIQVMERHKNVLILGHIGRSGLSFDVDEVLKAAKAMHKLIELNEHSFDSGEEAAMRCRRIAERCAELEVPVSISTDAHISCAVGKMEKTIRMLEEIHFPEELIASRDRNHFLDALQAGVGVNLQELKR